MMSIWARLFGKTDEEKRSEAELAKYRKLQKNGVDKLRQAQIQLEQGRIELKRRLRELEDDGNDAAIKESRSSAHG